MENLVENTCSKKHFTVTSKLIEVLSILIGEKVSHESIELTNKGVLNILSGVVVSLEANCFSQSLQKVAIKNSSGNILNLLNNIGINSTPLPSIKNLDHFSKGREIRISNLIDFGQIFNESLQKNSTIDVLYNKNIEQIVCIQISKLSLQDQSLTGFNPENNSSLSHVPLPIKIRFIGQFTESQKSIFRSAAKRWGRILYGNLPPVEVNGEIIDGLLITAESIVIDGQGRTLASSGPQHLRADTLIPITGKMEFDVADLQDMKEKGTLFDVAFHEIAHVLGFGTLWEELGLIQNDDQNHPVFVGENAMREFASILGRDYLIPVPIENIGGEGVRESHWRDAIFDNEVMTSFIQSSNGPISRITIAAFQDMGFKVNFSEADNFFNVPFSSLNTLEN